MKRLFYFFTWLLIISSVLTAQGQSTRMKPVKRFFVNTDPIGAEVLADGEKLGVTPCVISLGKGNHKIELYKQNYLKFKKYLFIGGKGSRFVDTLEYVLTKTTPIYVKSDIKGTDLLIKNHEDTVLFEKTPAELGLPFGKYTIELYNSGRRSFKGSFKNTGQQKVKLPCYSKGTFELLAVDYYFSKPLLTNEEHYDLYHLLATGQFGRFTVFPGFSTSILKASIFKMDKQYKNTTTTIINPQDTLQFKYPNHISAISLLFLNAEFRIGLPIFRLLDISALGTYTYYPNFTKNGTFHHVSGQDIFIGIELASRFPIGNINIKIGSKMLSNISYNFYTKENKRLSLNMNRDYSDYYYKVPAKLEQFVVSIGLTLGQDRGYSNNMLRLFKKPLFTNY